MNYRLINFITLIFLVTTSSIFSQDQNVSATIISRVSTLKSGDNFIIAIKLSHNNGWHTYWQNPGDSGMKTTIEWELPEGFEFVKAEWPAPNVIYANSSITFGYENEIIILNYLSSPQKTDLTQAIITANISWLECKDICQQGNVKISTVVSLEKKTKLSLRANLEFEKYKNSFITDPVDIKFKSENTDTSTIINISNNNASLATATNVYYIPYEQGVYKYVANQLVKTVNYNYQLEIPFDNYLLEKPDKLNGILIFSNSKMKKTFRINTSINKTEE